MFKTAGKKMMMQMNNRASTLPVGLLSYWKMDEGSGNRLDSVGGIPLAPTTGTPGSAAGKIGNCVTFPGTGTDYLMSGATASLLTIDWSLGFTVAGWVYVPAPFTDEVAVLAKSDGAFNNDWAFYLLAGPQMRLIVSDSTSGISLADAAGVILTDAWYFSAGRYNPATKKAEIILNNGAWQLGAALTNGPKNLRNRFHSGRYVTKYGKVNCDEIGVWTRYLSDAEVTELYNAGNGKTYPF